MAGDDNKRSIRLVAPEGVGPFLVNRFSGTEALGRLFEYRLELLSEDSAIEFAEVMGKAMTLVIAVTTDDAERLIHGYVSRFTQGDKLGRYTQYEATLVPYLWFLNRAADCRIMPASMTVPEIVKKLLAARDFTTIDDSRLRKTYLKRPFCVQYRETDFNFISRLLEEEGIYYYFEPERLGPSDDDGFKHVMVLCDAPTNHQTGKNCQALHVADRDSGVVQTVRSWNVSGEAHPDRSSLRDFRYETRTVLEGPGTVAYTPTDAKFPPPLAKMNLEIRDYPAGFHLQHENIDREALAATRAEEASSRRIVRHGMTSVHGVFPGVAIILDTPPPERYLVIEARFTGWSDVGESGLKAPDGEPYECSFDAIHGDRFFRPERVTPRPRIVGPQTALVVGDANKNAFTDEYGNVKVKFHWDHTVEKAEDETVSCFIRVAEPWAGNKWGAMFMPRVGHEVVVEFLEGDPDRPLITGRLYNKLSMPPYDPRQHASVSTIKSMTTDGAHGFNELRFEDKKGSEQVFINAQRQMDERVGASLYETVAGNREEHIGTDDKGDRNRLVSKDVNLHVKGGAFELYEKKLNTNVKLEVVQVYEDSHTIATTARQTLNAKEIAIEGKQAASLKSDKVILQGASGLSLKAGSIKIEGTQSVNLKVGGTFFVLSPSGGYLKAGTNFLKSGGAPQPADPPLTIQDPSIETPVDAAEATSALPGDHVAGGAPRTPRTRTTRKVPLQRAREPPLAVPAIPVLGSAVDRKLIDIAWVESETYCGGSATLKGTTKGYAAGATETAEVRNVVDGATVVAVPVVIQGDTFNQIVDVNDWLPRKGGEGLEESRDEDAYAAGKKTPKPLTMRFIPTLKTTECSLASRIGIRAQFSMTVKDYVCEVFEKITWVPGYLGQLIKLGASVPADTGGVLDYDAGPGDDNSLWGTGWRFAKAHDANPKKLIYWNGAEWRDVPGTWEDKKPGTKLFSIGVWKNGSKQEAQHGLVWPELISSWTAADHANADQCIATWTSQIKDLWTDKFDLRRDGCSSSNPKCCRYSLKVGAEFKLIEAAEKDAHTIIIAPNKARGNSGAWSLGDKRPSSAPHEFGHHLGCPDEYASGTRDKSVRIDIPDPSQPGVDSTSVMGVMASSGAFSVKARHFDLIKQHLAAMVKAQKGVTFTYSVVPHL